MPIKAEELDIEIAHEAVERTFEYWAFMAMRPKPKRAHEKELLLMQQVDKGAFEIMERAVALRERMTALKAPSEKRVRMA